MASGEPWAHIMIVQRAEAEEAEEEEGVGEEKAAEGQWKRPERPGTPPHDHSANSVDTLRVECYSP